KLLFNTDQMFARNVGWLAPFMGSVMNVLLPISYLQGSMAPVYDRLSGLLDRTSAAFPIVDGKVRMQIEVTLDAMPGLAAALPSQPSPPAPPAGPRAGGR
ncbi:MAG TPA: MCE family protein, partial [Mycobacterium sp.]|nr:MCE family protein [Mycobacterium sp.]